MSNAHAEQWKKLCKIKTLKHLKHTVKHKPEEHILNIIVQGSDNEILLNTPPPIGGRGFVFGRFLCFFVSNITRKRLDRFA